MAGGHIASINAPQRAPLAADRFEQALSLGAAILLAFVLAAVARGMADWPRVPVILWVHLAMMVLALALTPVMLLRRRGDRPHRVLGTIWVAAMLISALDSFLIRASNDGRFSVIHLLSVWVMIQVPVVWWAARTHRVAMHRRSVRGMVTGALLVAGFFTFPFNRLLGHWLFA